MVTVELDRLAGTAVVCDQPSMSGGRMAGKADLVDRIAELTGIPKTHVAMVYDNIFDLTSEELFGQAGVPFEVVPADIDEAPMPGEAPIEMAERLAREWTFNEISPGGFPSGQRGQTVNLMAMPSQVRILHPPLAAAEYLSAELQRDDELPRNTSCQVRSEARERSRRAWCKAGVV